MNLRPAFRRAPRLAAALFHLYRGRRPVFASVNLLNTCNQACPMCAVHAAPGVELSASTLAQAFGALRRGGVRIVELSGGEPFLRRDLAEILRALDQQGLLYSFNTNATAICDDGLEALRRSSGLVQVAVSLDSLCAERYRFLRGRDLLREALGGIERLAAAGLGAPLKLNFAMSRYNADEPGELLDFAASRGLFLSVFPVNQGPGHHRTEADLFASSPSERREMALRFEALARLRKRGAPLWEPSAFYRAAARFLRGEPLAPCGAGKLYLDIRADGGVAPCVELPAVSHVADLGSPRAWGALAASEGSVRACHGRTPCCYTCTVNLAETARDPVSYVAETARMLFLRARRERWAAALLAEERA